LEVLFWHSFKISLVLAFCLKRTQKDAKICFKKNLTKNLQTPKEHWNMRGGCFGVSVSKQGRAAWLTLTPAAWAGLLS
jgi:hypothetical protein